MRWTWRNPGSFGAWEAEEGGHGITAFLLYSFLLFPNVCSGESYPWPRAQRTDEAEDLLIMFARGCSEVLPSFLPLFALFV